MIGGGTGFSLVVNSGVVSVFRIVLKHLRIMDVSFSCLHNCVVNIGEDGRSSELALTLSQVYPLNAY